MADQIQTVEKQVIGLSQADDAVRTMDDFTSPETLFNELIARVKQYHPSDDLSMIEKAYRTAYDAHKN